MPRFSPWFRLRLSRKKPSATAEDSSKTADKTSTTADKPSPPTTTTCPKTTQDISNPQVLTPEVLGHEIVTIYVGPERKQFTVHKKLLVDRCSYFSKSFGGDFKEAKEGVMEMPEDDEVAVTYLIDFLYRGTVPEVVWKPGDKSLAKPIRPLYYLAEKLCFTQLMDRVIDEMTSKGNKYCKCFGGPVVQEVYQNTHRNSKLRVLAVATVACSVATIGYKDLERFSALERTTRQFFVDFWKFHAKYSKEVAAHRDKSGQELRDAVFGPCAFHTHGKDEECYLKTKEEADPMVIRPVLFTQKSN